MKNNDFPLAPLCLRKRAAAVAIENTINAAAAQNNLSFSDLEEILHRYYVEAKRGAEDELRRSEQEYKRCLEEYKRQKEEKEVDHNGRDAGNRHSESDS